ncbi:hypothetical protein TREMEDRAFT_61311 [Tremella mesenterica DSM 1558]|uniref:uncharacterized protein n=1 Tax=Tremella mesenterica (strain ATCC 24925 / CBS 8224 / DSM 1558 / NBRC 9311 / NRRL Y-6157 / RJB 2259-6 / UBC 559-6) TaxID=578456 RepID=UPI0003F48D19|nr:uncharacterized protein TREMEDRAFT_61311 [Tremella mesenterica DSM 1558]EIW70804.1 hypothetical protein TREMEDRAFT_61311 [Tremella mesenterica DSM 1558]
MSLEPTQATAQGSKSGQSDGHDLSLVPCNSELQKDIYLPETRVLRQSSPLCPEKSTRWVRNFGYIRPEDKIVRPLLINARIRLTQLELEVFSLLPSTEPNLETFELVHECVPKDDMSELSTHVLKLHRVLNRSCLRLWDESWQSVTQSLDENDNMNFPAPGNALSNLKQAMIASDSLRLLLSQGINIGVDALPWTAEMCGARGWAIWVGKCTELNMIETILSERAQSGEGNEEVCWDFMTDTGATEGMEGKGLWLSNPSSLSPDNGDPTTHIPLARDDWVEEEEEEEEEEGALQTSPGSVQSDLSNSDLNTLVGDGYRSESPSKDGGEGDILDDDWNKNPPQASRIGLGQLSRRTWERKPLSNISFSRGFGLPTPTSFDKDSYADSLRKNIHATLISFSTCHSSSDTLAAMSDERFNMDCRQYPPIEDLHDSYLSDSPVSKAPSLPPLSDDNGDDSSEPYDIPASPNSPNLTVLPITIHDEDGFSSNEFGNLQPCGVDEQNQRMMHNPTYVQPSKLYDPMLPIYKQVLQRNASRQRSNQTTDVTIKRMDNEFHNLWMKVEVMLSSGKGLGLPVWSMEDLMSPLSQTSLLNFGRHIFTGECPALSEVERLLWQASSSIGPTRLQEFVPTQGWTYDFRGPPKTGWGKPPRKLILTPFDPTGSGESLSHNESPSG